MSSVDRARLHFHFLTLFPEAVRVWLTTSILGRAHEAGLFTFNLVQLRDFTTDRHRAVDDVAYGGGGGMVLKVEPLARAVESLRELAGEDPLTVIYFTPVGRPLDQRLLRDCRPETGKQRHFVLVCGHYEGVDQRFLDHWVDLEVSLGDFVLTGGELPAVAFADGLIRQLEGALGEPTAPDHESFTLREGKQALLEYPHYTRPAEFRGHKVPDVLLGGNHGHVDEWRREQAIARTRARRPDLLTKEEGV